MLHISKGNPWVFWPNHICDTFPINPANKQLRGDKNFTLTLDVTINKVKDEIGTILTLLPRYTAIDIYKGRLLFTITKEDEQAKYFDLPTTIHDGVDLKIQWKHISREYFEVFINREKVLHVPLQDMGFGIAENPHIIFGAGNFPKNGFNLNYTDITLHYFTIDDAHNKTLCQHKFKKYIFDKSFDLTDNCNFIHKI